ncbi:NUDIX domain-containing protein [Xanthobacter agilis]|uniref:8-oxo-dGTP pyrophosphatase MutT (NUDIX family) n=1 Tax=Xanthobacter agilis TaxID=47492 RepID=A0ABU0L9T5_XANAG|nr:NUDIX domain-containing protein [Xanthobacter agilis]MDQ0503902.1 8-oxo-dGTP pyrophosphatase MutT (NUDIX family) [Xanthobacter agilis]
MFQLLPVIRRLRHGLTLGVRVLAHDGEGRLLLVKHSYTPGWHLPGGGVDAGESAAAAAHRELKEEANAQVEGPLELHGLFFHPAYGGRDHVVCFRGRVRGGPAPRPNLEILAASFFPFDALPPDTTPATLRRIAEWRAGMPLSEAW